MKKIAIIVAGIVIAFVAVRAAQDTSLTQREVRDPRQLETWLEGNASDAETRLDSAETSTASLGAALVASNGVFNLVSGTQLVFIVSGVTNVIDADTSTP